MDPITLGILAAVAFLAGGALAWNAVRNWMTGKPSARLGVVVKEALANGDLRVVANVFDADDRFIDRESWTASNIDSELAKRFGSSNRFHVRLN